MLTLILSGFSLKNKDWAEKTKEELAPDIESQVIYWPHWESEKPEDGWIENETEKIITREDPQVNIIAKSVGTLVAMHVLERKPEMVGKLILCGIPLYDFQEGDPMHYKVLRDFPEDMVLCIQNENDNHGSFEAVEKFIHSTNPKLRILSKPRDDHEYPFTENFKEFLI